MSAKTQVLATVDPRSSGGTSFAGGFRKAERFVQSLGIKKRLRMKDSQKTAADIEKRGKPADYLLELDGFRLAAMLVYGSKRVPLLQLDLESQYDTKKLRKLLRTLQSKTKLVDAATMGAFEANNPDPDRIRELESTLRDAELEMESDASALRTLQKFRYEKDRYSGQGGLMMQIIDEAKKKKLDGYFRFLEAIDRNMAADKVYETFLSSKAKKRIRLPSKITDRIRAAMKAGKRPDFDDARKITMRIIDKRIVPKVSSRLIAIYKKSLMRQKKLRDVAQRELKGMMAGAR